MLCVCVLERIQHVPPVAGGLCASVPQLSSPAKTPTVSSFVGSGWLQLCSALETSACAHQGPALLSSCDGFHHLLLLLSLLHQHCNYYSPALRAGNVKAGRAASVAQLVISANNQTGNSQSVCLSRTFV